MTTITHSTPSLKKAQLANDNMGDDRDRVLYVLYSGARNVFYTAVPLISQDTLRVIKHAICR